MPSTSCPSRGELFGFLLGNLPRSAFDRVAGHIDHCAACEATLASFDSLADPLVVQLRVTTDDALTTEDVGAEVMAVARSAILHGRPGDSKTPSWPRQIGKFELLEELGLGSFGQVFRARDTELGRTVAVKILRAGNLASPEDIDRFLREGRSVAGLNHPGIVGLYEAGRTEEGTCYLVEEFIEGQTLSARLSANRLGFRESAQLIAEVAEALDYAHRHGVIHRDVKPSNIMLDGDSRAHLMDFGLAKREADEPPLTLEGQVLGTPDYMSPEQARGESHQVDARSDIYSLGVVLYELLTKERPFRGNRRMLLLQVLQDEPRPPRQMNDKVPRDLETICLKALAKAPGRRYATARDLAADLWRYLNGEPILARPAGPLVRLGRWCRRNPVVTGLLIAVTLGSAMGLAHLSSLSQWLVRQSALESAAQESLLLEEAHDLYSGVVKRVESARFLVNYETRQDQPPKEGEVPLLVPATFTHLLGQRVNDKSDQGMRVRLYSDYPFEFRTDGGPRDEFQRDALNSFREHPGQDVVYEFSEYEGQPVLRYVKAWVLKPNCIYCHNHHEDSPKRDWQEGQVRGALEITRFLNRDEARVRDGLRGTFVLMAVVSGSLLGLSVLVLVLGNRPRTKL